MSIRISWLALLSGVACSSSNGLTPVPQNNGGGQNTSTTTAIGSGGTTSTSSSSGGSANGGTQSTASSTGGTLAGTGGDEATGGSDDSTGGASPDDTSTGGDDGAGGTEPTSDGGAESTGGDEGAGGTTAEDATGGAQATGGTTATSTDVCADGTPFTIPSNNGKMTDFSEITETTFGVDSSGTATNVKWGTTGLTGGTFFYQQDSTDGIQINIVGGAAVATANIAANHYAGFGLYFGPNCGSNACGYAGFSFTVLGDLGGATADIQVQMTPDYPLDSDDKGTCDYASAGEEMWTYCTNPHAALTDLLTSELSSTAQVVSGTWSAFSGGNPVSALDCGQLLGIQIQLNCGDTACTPSLTIDDLKFYE